MKDHEKYRLVVSQSRYLAAAAAVLLTTSLAAFGQSDPWHPSRWGESDQRGAANRLTPEKVLEAKDLIKKGVVYQLGRVYESNMPLMGGRHFSLRIPQAFGPLGTNQFYYYDEIVSGELGQVGTQFDGLGHVAIGDLFYNGNNRKDIARPEGLTRLGVENVGPLVTRGVLVDVARYKGVPQLQRGYEITVEDLKGALQRQNIKIHSGDVVVIHTGWGSLWMKDNARYAQGSPGIGISAAQFLVDAEIIMVGADTWGVEVSPNANPSFSGSVHQLLVARNGIHLHENLATEDLARDNVYEFAFIFTPLLLKGATGSPGGPIAIR